MPDWKLVHSGWILAVGREGNDLLVQFKSGPVYRFAGAAAHHDGILNAKSPGSYFRDNVRDKYKHTKV